MFGGGGFGSNSNSGFGNSGGSSLFGNNQNKSTSLFGNNQNNSGKGNHLLLLFSLFKVGECLVVETTTPRTASLSEETAIRTAEHPYSVATTLLHPGTKIVRKSTVQAFFLVFLETTATTKTLRRFLAARTTRTALAAVFLGIATINLLVHPFLAIPEAVSATPATQMELLKNSR